MNIQSLFAFLMAVSIVKLSIFCEFRHLAEGGVRGSGETLGVGGCLDADSAACQTNSVSPLWGPGGADIQFASSL